MVADDPESFADLDGHGCYLSLNGGGGISCNGDTWLPYAKTGEGNGAPGNSGVAAAPAASGAETQLVANQQANQNTNQQAQDQKPALTVSLVDGHKDFTGEPIAEAGAEFTVAIQSSTNFAPGNLTVTADLHFDADKRCRGGN